MDYKAKARAYHTAVSAYDAVTVTQMVREDYVQHNPRVPTGRAAFVGMLPKLAEHQTKIVNVRMLSDGDYVIMHHVWKNAVPFGGEEMAAFHIIRFDDQELIAEHWSVMTPHNKTNPLGRSPVEGATEVRDQDATGDNKAAIVRVFEWLVKEGPTGPLRIDYKKQHKVLGEGNFVLSIAEGLMGNTPTAFYDLFRLEHGQIVDSWNVYQEIPTEGLANANTMFGFR